MFLQPPTAGLSKKTKKRRTSLKCPISKEKRISFKSPMAPIKETGDEGKDKEVAPFEADPAVASSSSEELSLSPTNYRRDIASKVIGITFFDTRKYPECNSEKGTIGAVSNFSTSKSTMPKNSKNSRNSKYLYETSSEEYDSDFSEDPDWTEKKQKNLLAKFNDETKSKRFNENIRRNSAYLLAAPVKQCQCQIKKYLEDSDSSDDEEEIVNNCSNSKVTPPDLKRDRRMTIKVEPLRI